MTGGVKSEWRVIVNFTIFFICNSEYNTAGIVTTHPSIYF